MRSRLAYILIAVAGMFPVTAWADHSAAPGLGLPPVEVNLTKDSVERLLAAIPELTDAASAQQARLISSGMAMGPGAKMPQLKPEEIAKVRAIFSKYGFTMQDFFMQMSALVATYMALRPKVFDEQLPSADKPEVQAILNDPKVPDAQKDNLRAQIAFAQKNKEKLRKQVTALASSHNKEVVRPLLPKVKKVFDAAQERAREAMKQATAQRGPRREPHR